MITIETLRFWCQKVLPLVYDDSLSYYELLCKIVEKTNELVNQQNTTSAEVAELDSNYTVLSNKVDGLIENLVDVISPWDSSVAYRIFTIVEYQGTNYIAVQDVPIGTMITNTDYWQPANTVLEQLNAIGVTVSEMNSKFYYVTPEDYGAVGDGVTDDSSAIISAIGSHRIVNFSADKTYKIDSTIRIEDVDYCILNLNYCTLDAEDDVFTVVNCNNLLIRDGYIKANGNRAIVLTSDTSEDRNGNTTFDNIRIFNASEYVRVDGATGYNYFNKIKCNQTPSGSTGFIVGENRASGDTIGANYVYITECSYEGGFTGTGKHGITLKNAKEIYISKCDLANIVDGSALNLETSGGAHSIMISENSFYNNVDNIYINNTSLFNANIVNNLFYLYNAQRAIYKTSTSSLIDGGLIITGNTFNGSTTSTEMLNFIRISKLYFKNNLLGNSALRPLLAHRTSTISVDNAITDMPLPKRITHSGTGSFTVTMSYNESLYAPRYYVAGKGTFTFSINNDDSTGTSTITINVTAAGDGYYYVIPTLG